MSLAVIGHAIVSADGMIADRDHRMPAALRNDADWERFQAALDGASIVVLGRIGHEAHPNPGRRRLVATSRVADLVPDPRDKLSMLWNPLALGINDALQKLDIHDGVVAVAGGQPVFDLFLPHYTQFDLVESPDVTVPDGVTCFSKGSPRTMLHNAGLCPTTSEPLDGGVTLTIWRRPGLTL